MSYVLSHEALDGQNSSSREHWLKDILSRVRLHVHEQPEGGAERFIKGPLLVPLCRRIIDFVVRRWFGEVSDSNGKQLELKLVI